MRPNQKFGIDSPKKAAPVEIWSNNEYCRIAEYTPMPTPTIRENTVATLPRTNVFQRASLMSLATGWLVRSDTPQSPRTKWVNQVVYCSTPDLFSPSFSLASRMAFGSARGLFPRDLRKSPFARMTTNTRTLDTRRTGIEKITRRAM